MNKKNKPALAIESLETLQAICDKPLKVRITIDDQPVEVTCRRLSPAETGAITLMLNEALPPIIKADPNKANEQDRFDLSDPSYQRKRSELEACAKAMTVYLGCPIYRNAAPGLKDRDEIRKFVESKLTEQVLEALWLGITRGAVSLEDHVNFT